MTMKTIVHYDEDVEVNSERGAEEQIRGAMDELDYVHEIDSFEDFYLSKPVKVVLYIRSNGQNHNTISSKLSGDLEFAHNVNIVDW